MTSLEDAARLHNEGREREAIAALRTALDDGESHDAVRAALLLGYLLEGNGDLDGAADAYRRGCALRDEEFSPLCYFSLGVLSASRGDLAEARAAYTRAVESGHYEHAPKAGFNLALIQHGAGEIYAAIASYRAVVAFGHPEQTPKAARNLGGLLAQKRDFEGAAAAYRTVIDAGPSDHVPAAAVGLGAALTALGDTEGAIAAYTLAADSGDDEAAPVAVMELGAAAQRRGDTEEAERRYRQAADSGHSTIEPRAHDALESLAVQANSNGLRGILHHVPPRCVEKLPDYYPMGFGGGVPVVMMPWDDLGSALGRHGYYEAQPHGGDPMRNAPRTDAEGGVVYFDADEDRERLTTLFSVLGINARRRDYAVVWTESDNPQRDGFITCLRVISTWALGKFDAQAAAAVTEQPLQAGEVLHRFVQEQVRLWGPDGTDSLRGMFGGDGDWAKEALCFGVMMENPYYQVYRIWSRAWLVTK